MADGDAFDAIIIGAGLAGLSAAYRLAQAGRDVLVVERGPYVGAKTFTGGRLYTYALEQLLGEEWTQAPLQREVDREIVSILTATDAMNIDSTFAAPGGRSFTVLSTPLVQWLAEKVEQAGGSVVPGMTVTGLLRADDGAVRGVRIGEEELEAALVVDGEGINPLVFERAGLVRRLRRENVAVGAKYLFRLPEAEINSRFTTTSGRGAAMLGLGEVTQGVYGGMFLYTNTDTLCLGIVVDSDGWRKGGKNLVEAVEDMRRHPAIGRYVEGAELVEYGGHLVYEGGIDTVPQLAGDGWLIGGDAAGFCINRGFTIRGMDYAITSGIAAGETAVEALESGDVSAAGLAGYRRRLDGGVLADMGRLRNAHHFMGHNPDLFTTYPGVAVDLMRELFAVDGSPLRPVRTTLGGLRSKVRVLPAARTLLQGVRSL